MKWLLEKIFLRGVPEKMPEPITYNSPGYPNINVAMAITQREGRAILEQQIRNAYIEKHSNPNEPACYRKDTYGNYYRSS